MCEPVLLSYLIPVLGTLLGALIGFGGSLLVNDRSQKSARKLALDERTRGRQADALMMMLGHISAIDEHFDSFLAASRDDRRDTAVRVLDAVKEARRDFRVQFLWLPKNPRDRIRDAFLAYVQRVQELSKASDGFRSEPDRYEGLLNETKSWAQGDLVRRFAILTTEAQAMLGIHETITVDMFGEQDLDQIDDQLRRAIEDQGS